MVCLYRNSISFLIYFKFQFLQGSELHRRNRLPLTTKISGFRGNRFSMTSGKLSQAWKSSTGGVYKKRCFLKISQNLQENTCVSLFFNKVAGLRAQVFSCEFFKVFKNTFFTEHLGRLLLF